MALPPPHGSPVERGSTREGIALRAEGFRREKKQGGSGGGGECLFPPSPIARTKHEGRPPGESSASSSPSNDRKDVSRTQPARTDRFPRPGGTPRTLSAMGSKVAKRAVPELSRFRHLPRSSALSFERDGTIHSLFQTGHAFLHLICDPLTRRTHLFAEKVTRAFRHPFSPIVSRILGTFLTIPPRNRHLVLFSRAG